MLSLFWPECRDELFFPTNSLAYRYIHTTERYRTERTADIIIKFNWVKKIPFMQHHGLLLKTFVFLSFMLNNFVVGDH